MALSKFFQTFKTKIISVGSLTLLITIRMQNNHLMHFHTFSLIFHTVVCTAKCTSPVIALYTIHNCIALACALLESNVHINQYFFDCISLKTCAPPVPDLQGSE